MKKRYIVLIILLCVLIGLGAFFGQKIYRAVRVYTLAEEFLTRQVQSLDVTVMTEGNRNVSFRLDWQEAQGKRVFTAHSSGETVYFCDGVLYLKNGKGYGFSEALPDLTPVLENPWILCPLVQIQKEENQWILSMKTEEFLPQIRNLNVTFVEEDNEICSLQCNTWGAEVGDFIGLQASVHSERNVEPIPQAVTDSIASGALQGGKDLTQDVLRLLKGWMLLGSTDPLGMEIGLDVELLTMPLHTDMALYTTKVHGRPVSWLSKNGVGFYFTDDAACTAEGVKIDTPDATLEPEKLLGFAYYLCFNGNLSCEGDTYRLALDQQGMEQVLYTLAPEAKDLALTLKEGTLELHMDGEEITSISIVISGQVDLVLTQVDISAAVNMEVVQEAFSFNIPQSVLDALLE